MSAFLDEGKQRNLWMLDAVHTSKNVKNIPYKKFCYFQYIGFSGVDFCGVIEIVYLLSTKDKCGTLSMLCKEQRVLSCLIYCYSNMSCGTLVSNARVLPSYPPTHFHILTFPRIWSELSIILPIRIALITYVGIWNKNILYKQLTSSTQWLGDVFPNLQVTMLIAVRLRSL